MPRIDKDETWDTDGNLISSVPRVVTDKELEQMMAYERLRAVPSSDLKGTPWGPIIADILMVLGYR